MVAGNGVVDQSLESREDVTQSGARADIINYMHRATGDGCFLDIGEDAK